MEVSSPRPQKSFVSNNSDCAEILDERQEGSEELNDDSRSMILGYDDISDVEMLEQIPKDAQVNVTHGRRFDMESIKIEEAIP